MLRRRMLFLARRRMEMVKVHTGDVLGVGKVAYGF